MVSKVLLFLLPLIINLYLSFATNKSSDLNYNEIQGTFYSSSQEFNFEIDSINASALLKYGFDPEKETKILVHGWVMDGHYFAQQFANAYHKYHPGKFNVIGINWKKLANSDNYFQACINSNQVGIYLGEHFISQLLVKQLGSKPDNIHAIGHSLGAHLVGLLGRTVHEKTGQKLARITGLDPAKPYFDLVSKDQRLQNTDATLVDVIHSNSGFIWEGGLSMPEPMGTIDFYPNGGLHQPGCAEFCLGSACIDIDVIDLLMFGEYIFRYSEIPNIFSRKFSYQITQPCFRWLRP